MKQNTDDYSDIIHLPYRKSQKHPPMPLHDRAAQFAPFAALTGYEAAISEAARLTDRKFELDDESAAVLNERLLIMQEHISDKPLAEITYFVPDSQKSGGSYITVKGNVRHIDLVGRFIKLTDGTEIHIDDIFSVILTEE